MVNSVAATGADCDSHLILEWYDFGRAEWAHVGRGVLAFVLGTALPVGGFYAVYRLVSFQSAVLVVLAWSGCVFAAHYARTRELDIFSLTTVALACIKATVGILAADVRLYLVWPSVENLLYASVFLGSALVGHPLLAAYARRLYPIPVAVSYTPAFRHGFLVASAAWAVVSVLRAALRVWLAANLGTGVFLLVDTLVGWPVYLALIWFTGWYPLRLLRHNGQVLP